jgi:hypothetical protein
MRDAGFEVIVEALRGRLQAVGIISHDAGAQITSDRARGRKSSCLLRGDGSRP